MAVAQVLLIGTWQTKASELAALSAALGAQGVSVRPIDLSLGCDGGVLDASAKLQLMQQRATQGAQAARAAAPDCLAAVALGGGTGSEIALHVLRALPLDLPKLLVTTLAMDPRAPLADCGIVIVPTLCDIEGMNPMLAQVFEMSAAMVAGLARMRPGERAQGPSVALTTLGATAAASLAMGRDLAARGAVPTVFHANGYGGAAFARFVREGRAAAVLDLNVHELGRMRLAGMCAPMPDRFTCAGSLPRVVLPGALNFLGLGALDTLSPAHRARPFYRHSGLFTHVQLSEDEMAAQAEALAGALNAAPLPALLVIPMGGFSHEDRPGGAIEAPHLRGIAADILTRRAQSYAVETVPHHINAPETARRVVAALHDRMSHD
ncbi:MAG: Tm-1-like ATP-binding domain-containing protein [Roseinatronobacter sp.]